MESHYPLGLMLRGEKNNSSALNVGSVPPSPYRPFSRSRGLSTPTMPQRLFLAPLRNALVGNTVPYNGKFRYLIAGIIVNSPSSEDRHPLRGDRSIVRKIKKGKKHIKEVVSTATAPVAIGPYSQAIKVTAPQMLFCSGQLPLDPANGQLATDSYAEQTRRVMDNLNAFSEVNSVYQSYFSEDFPARTTVQVDALPRGADLKTDAIVA